MGNENSVYFKIKTLLENKGFVAFSDTINGTKRRVDSLNGSYSIQGKTIGQLETAVKRYGESMRDSTRKDHIEKYNNLIDRAKQKINELSGATEKMGGRTSSVFRDVFGANLLTKGLGIVKSGIAGFISSSEEAYRSQAVSIGQLSQVMKNTMNGNEWDVKDIVNYTKEQEKVGIISKQVQLAGSKELGTYLTKRDSLKKLIPVMNDMLAHQTGFNSSQTDALGIAQMMGKVLDGQVGALSRAGYTFSEAQEEILKYGNESERVAVLSEVVSTYVGGVNQALSETPEGKIRQASLEYLEMQERLGALTTKIKGEATVVFQRFATAIWENRGAFLTIGKTVGVAVTALAAYKGVVLAAGAALRSKNTIIGVTTAMKRVFTGQVNLATVAMRAFNAASKANIIGAVVGLITAAVGAFALFRKKTDETSEAMQRAKDAAGSYYSQERSGLDMMFEKLKQTNPKSKERNRLVDELKTMYPDLNEQMEHELRNTNNLSTAYDTLIEKIGQKAKLKAKEALLEDLYKETNAIDDIVQEATDAELKARPTQSGFIQNPDGGFRQAEIERNRGTVAKEIRTKLLSSGSYKAGDMIYVLADDVRTKAVAAEAKIENILSQIATSLEGNKSAGIATGVGTLASSDSGVGVTKASDTITGGGKSQKNFYINIDSLIGSNTNHFASSDDNPSTAGSFMGKLSEALQKVVNDVNYSAG